MTYTVKDFIIGLYDYDTLIIADKNKKEHQIPIKKGIGKPELIGKEIEIKNLYTPIKEV